MSLSKISKFHTFFSFQRNREINRERCLMDTLHKIEVFKDACSNDAEIDQVLGKLFDIALSRHQRQLERYEQDLGGFEKRYSMDSGMFYERFEAGELGDAMDFFEWAGLYKLRQDILEKIRRLGSGL